jgi:hypothetical protein
MLPPYSFVNNKHFGVFHAHDILINMRLNDHYIREAVDCIKIDYVPDIFVPMALGV